MSHLLIVGHSIQDILKVICVLYTVDKFLLLVCVQLIIVDSLGFFVAAHLIMKQLLSILMYGCFDNVVKTYLPSHLSFRQAKFPLGLNTSLISSEKTVSAKITYSWV